MLLKNLILKIRLKFFPKDTSYERHNINFSEAKEIGLLIYASDLEEINNINTFVAELINSGKKVKGISFYTKKIPTHFDFPCIYVSSKELDWKGDFKGEEIKMFIKTEFDYLYSINFSPFLPFENIIRKSKAKFRVGHYDPNSDLDLMIKTDEKQNIKFLGKMLMYSKKLKSNE